MEGNGSDNLNLLCIGSKRKVKCYNGYFFNGYIFYTEKYGQGRKNYNSEVCVKGSTSNEFKSWLLCKVKEVIELQYHNEKNKSFYLNVIGIITLIEESESIPTMIWLKLIQRVNFTMLTISIL